jgi:phosphonate transport system substrate-binding protein
MLTKLSEKKGMMGYYRGRKLVTGMLALAGLLLLLVTGCASTAATATPFPAAAPPIERSQVITLGDIDPANPAKKIKQTQPLADYLAERLSEFGIREGRVVIARSMEEMGSLLAAGTVDFYFDSPFPALRVQQLSGSQIVARRWRDGAGAYWSVYIARRDSGITRVEDFVGKVVAFEEPFSTSGFALPAGTLIQRGFKLKEIPKPDSQVAPNEIGYFFSQDEENTIALVLQRQAAAGGVSNQDYDELPAELKEQLVAFSPTISVPRQLVSVRPGLDPALVKKAKELLFGLDQTEEGLQILKTFSKTEKIDALPSDSAAALNELQVLMKLVAK